MCRLLSVIRCGTFSGTFSKQSTSICSIKSALWNTLCENENQMRYIFSFSLLHVGACCRHGPSCFTFITLHSLLVNLLTDDISFLLCPNAACCLEPSASLRQIDRSIDAGAHTHTKSRYSMLRHICSELMKFNRSRKGDCSRNEQKRKEKSTYPYIFSFIYKWFSPLIDIG